MDPLFPQIGQICMVVEDAVDCAKRWNDSYGIGPWHFLHFDETNMSKMTVHGKPVEYAMDIALCNMYDNLEIELIAPRDSKSAYAEFLREHGPGLHHIAMVTPHNTFGKVTETLDRRGVEHIQGGADPMGQEFAYYDLTRELGFIVELNDRPDDFHPLPGDERYPE